MKLPQAIALPKWLERTLLVGLILIFVLMPVHAFISTWGGTVVGPLWLWKSWKEILLIVLYLLLAGALLARPKLFYKLATDRLLQVTVIFALWFFLMLMVDHTPNGVSARAAAVALDLRYFAIFILGYILAGYGKSFDWVRWRRWAVAFLVTAGTLMAMVGILQATILPNDLLAYFGYNKETTIAPYTLVDLNPEAPRAFATLRGPNDFGAFLILPILLTLTLIKRKWLSWGMAAIMLLGLFYSASRSAWIGMVVAGLVFLTLRYGKAVFRSRQVVIGGLVGLISLIFIGVASLSVPAVRLAIFHSQLGDTSLTEGSTDAHFDHTLTGFNYVISHPLGCGPGCAGPASYYGDSGFISENYYLQLAEELGLVGLGIWLSVVALVTRRLYGARKDWLTAPLIASFVGISVIGMFLHVWADDPLSLTWWVLAGLVLGDQLRKRVAKPMSLS